MYAPVEQAILADYFRLDWPDSDDDLDLWEPDPAEPDAIHLEPDCCGSRDTDQANANAVARIALSRVQKMLPQFAVCYPDKIEFGRNIEPARRRPVEVLPRHLFTIDWAMTAPGVSWPEAYYLTWLPGIDRWLVTASRDSPEVGGYCDNALGHFGAEEDPVEGAGSILIEVWGNAYQAYDQQRWEVFFESGMVGRFTAGTWADEVWNIDSDVEAPADEAMTMSSQCDEIAIPVVSDIREGT